MASGYRIGAAVLIGGRSSRMGRPKEDMIIPGSDMTFLDHICNEVDSCFGGCLYKRYLSVRKGQLRERKGYLSVEDIYDDIGPLGGLVSVLKRASVDGCDALLLLACDMIRYKGEEIKRICENYAGEDILFARTEKTVLQPLASIYGTGILETAQRQTGSDDHRMRKLAGDGTVVAYYDSDTPNMYDNINILSQNLEM